MNENVELKVERDEDDVVTFPDPPHPMLLTMIASRNKEQTVFMVNVRPINFYRYSMTSSPLLSFFTGPFFSGLVFFDPPREY
jgi:hypothetical protein